MSTLRLPACEEITPAAPLPVTQPIRRLTRDFALSLQFIELDKAMIRNATHGAFVAFMAIPAGFCVVVAWHADPLKAMAHGIQENHELARSPLPTSAVYFLVNAKRRKEAAK